MKHTKYDSMKTREYNWLDKTITIPEDKKVQSFLRSIDRKQIEPAIKRLLGLYYINNADKLSDKPNLKTLQNTEEYKKFTHRQIEDDKTKIMLSGMMIIMTGTLVLFFIRAIIARQFVIHFAVDAIVGSIGLVLLVVNLRLKYRVIHMYMPEDNRFLFMDGITFAICIAFKFLVPMTLDASLIFLLVTYFFTKRRFSQEVAAYDLLDE